MLEVSLRLWIEQFPEQKELQPVEVVEVAAPLGGNGVSFSTPDGFRFDGLDVDDAMIVGEFVRCS